MSLCTSQQGTSFVVSALSSCPDLRGWTVTWKYKSNKPFQPQVASGQCPQTALESNIEDLRTPNRQGKTCLVKRPSPQDPEGCTKVKVCKQEALPWSNDWSLSRWRKVKDTPYEHPPHPRFPRTFQSGFYKALLKASMLMHTCDPNIQEAKAGGLLFKASPDYLRMLGQENHLDTGICKQPD